MTDKIKIGEIEYRRPFVIGWVGTLMSLVDSDGKKILLNDMKSALNELASLRTERDGLKAEVERLRGEIREAFDIIQIFCEFNSSYQKDDCDAWLKRNKPEKGGGE